MCKYKILPALIFATMIGAARLDAQTIEITNNQPFAVKMPITIKGVTPTENGQMSDGAARQRTGDGFVFVTDLPASTGKTLTMRNEKAKNSDELLRISPNQSGVDVNFAGVNLEKLSWQIVYRDAKPEELKGVPVSTKTDLAVTFVPLLMKFAKVSEGAVFDVWRGAGESDGLRLTIELRVYHEGFLDVIATLKNISAAKVTDVYAGRSSRAANNRTKRRERFVTTTESRISRLKISRISASAKAATGMFSAALTGSKPITRTNFRLFG